LGPDAVERQGAVVADERQIEVRGGVNGRRQALQIDRMVLGKKDAHGHPVSF
jgi:hypothetical protein